MPSDESVLENLAGEKGCYDISFYNIPEKLK